MKRIEIIEIPEQFYFKVSAAARYLGLSANTLRKYTDLGYIRAKRLPSGDRIYSRADLDGFVSSLDDAVTAIKPVGRHLRNGIKSRPSNLSASPGSPKGSTGKEEQDGH